MRKKTKRRSNKRVVKKYIKKRKTLKNKKQKGGENLSEEISRLKGLITLTKNKINTAKFNIETDQKELQNKLNVETRSDEYAKFLESRIKIINNNIARKVLNLSELETELSTYESNLTKLEWLKTTFDQNDNNTKKSQLDQGQTNEFTSKNNVSLSIDNSPKGISIPPPIKCPSNEISLDDLTIANKNKYCKKDDYKPQKLISLKLHPDKNPDCLELSTKKFQELGKLCDKQE